jgi:hypothetical protein
MKKFYFCFFFPFLLFLIQGCYNIKSSSGGGEGVNFSGSRNTNPRDIALPEGYS